MAHTLTEPTLALAVRCRCHCDFAQPPAAFSATAHFVLALRSEHFAHIPEPNTRLAAAGHPRSHFLTGFPLPQPLPPLHSTAVAMGNSKSKSKKDAPPAAAAGSSSSAPAESGPSGIRASLSLSQDVDPAAAPLADGAEFTPAAGAPELLETQESAISFWDKGKVRADADGTELVL